MEEIKSMAPDADYINLGKPINELDVEYIPIMFDGKNLCPDDTLCNLFNYCVTNDEGYTSMVAMGFVGNIPTQACTDGNELQVFVCGSYDCSQWQADLFNNFFCMDASEFRCHTTIFDTYNEELVDVELLSDSRILMRFYAPIA